MADAFGESEDDLFYWMITGAVAFGIAWIFVGRNEANKQYRKMRAKQEKQEKKEAEARQAGESPVSLSNIAESSGARP